MTIIQPLRNKTKGNKKRERDDLPKKPSCNANTKTEDFTIETETNGALSNTQTYKKRKKKTD